jgi:optic atrophy 3 protein
MCTIDLLTRCLRRAIENGANFIAESFLFGVAAALVIGETWRSSRNQSRRRDDVDDRLDDLAVRVEAAEARAVAVEEYWQGERQRSVFSSSLSSIHPFRSSSCLWH